MSYNDTYDTGNVYVIVLFG